MKRFHTYFVVIAIYCFSAVLFSPVFAASDLEEGVQELAQQISKNMTTGNKKKIAIIEFSDLNGNISAFGQFLAEELITQLFMISPGQFEVVERRQLMKVLNEQKLSMTGLLDAKAMESVGKILGIEAIVTGSLADLGNDIKVNARLIGVDTAKVFAVASTKIPKVGTVANLIAKEAASVQIVASPGRKVVSQPSNVSNPKPIKVGPLIVFMKRIVVRSKGSTSVMLDFSNQSDEVFHLIEDHFGNVNYPKLTDENGNIFEYNKQTGTIRDKVSLNPKTKGTVFLHFKPKNSINIKEIGPSFSITIPFLLSPEPITFKSYKEYGVSFSDIKAQMPQ